MNYNNSFYLILILITLGCKNKELNLAPKILSINKYHNQEVEDSYSYMENLKDSLVLKWLILQEKHANNIISSISNRNSLRNKIANFNFDKADEFSLLKITENNLHFYLNKNIKENTIKLFYKNGFNGNQKLLFDPKNFKPNSKEVYSINYIQPSWDGKKIAISLTKNDIEISEIVILDVDSRKLYDKTITNCWPSALGGVSWLPDNSGFYYVHIPTIDKKSKNYIKNTATVLYKLDNFSNNLNVVFSKANNIELSIKSHDFPAVQYLSNNDSYILGLIAGIGFYDSYYSTLNNTYSDKFNWKPLFKKEDKVKQFLIKGNDFFFPII